MDEKRHRIDPQKLEFARGLRREAPFPERLLWSRLRGERLAGLKFRRQHVVGAYVVDFYCPAASLVVELDGMSHVGRAKEDERRSEFLRRAGLRVVRYTNDQVLGDLDVVLADIVRQAVG